MSKFPLEIQGNIDRFRRECPSRLTALISPWHKMDIWKVKSSQPQPTRLVSLIISPHHQDKQYLELKQGVAWQLRLSHLSSCFGHHDLLMCNGGLCGGAKTWNVVCMEGMYQMVPPNTSAGCHRYSSCQGQITSGSWMEMYWLEFIIVLTARIPLSSCGLL